MATGGDHDRLRVTVLTGEANWALWKVQMRPQLRSRKLWDIVKGEERIATGAEQGENTAFEERCIDATMRLTFAMSPAVVLLVQNLDCPVMIWDKVPGYIFGHHNQLSIISHKHISVKLLNLI